MDTILILANEAMGWPEAACNIALIVGVVIVLWAAIKYL